MAVVAAVLGVAVALQLLRQTGEPAWRTVWAEDGRVYFEDAVAHPVASLATTYFGYLQALPRLLALPTPLLPVEWLAPYFALTGAVVTTAVGLGVYRLSDDLIPSTPLRVVLALAGAFHPVMAFEVLNTATNVIWPLAFLCFWALLRTPRSSREAAVCGGIAFVAAVSQVLVTLFVPLALVLAARERTRERRLVTGALLAGVAVQAVFVLGAGDAPRDGTSERRLLPLYVVRVVAGALLGERWLEDSWRATGWLVIGAAAALVAGVVVVLFARSTERARLAGGLALAYSVVMFLFPVWFRGTAAIPLEDGEWFSGGARFAGLSLLLLLSAVFILLSGARLPGATRRVLTAVIVAHFAFVAAFGFRFDNLRSSGPDWSESVAAGRRECAVTAVDRVTLAISPPAPEWVVDVSCGRLGDG